MLKRILVAMVLGTGPLWLSGCGEPPQQPTALDNDDNPETAEQFHAPLKEVARTYEGYGRVDQRKMRWAPTYCRAPIPMPHNPVMSASGDSETHGRKLYSLFVSQWPKDAERPDNYASKTSNPVGQVIVKESWVPKLVAEADVKHEPVVGKLKGTRTTADGQQEPFEIEDRFMPYADKDGKWYHASERGALFIMMKLDPSTPGTDRGWVYGVVSPDAKEVQAAGRIESCMNCHEDAPFDRLFGLPKD